MTWLLRTPKPSLPWLQHMAVAMATADKWFCSRPFLAFDPAVPLSATGDILQPPAALLQVRIHGHGWREPRQRTRLHPIDPSPSLVPCSGFPYVPDRKHTGSSALSLPQRR